VLKPTVRTMLVPVPKTAPIGGQPLRDTELLAWSGQVIRSVLADLPAGALSGGVPRAGQENRRPASRSQTE
jgi:transcription-repair coupling factor (superfamily II helicase)